MHLASVALIFCSVLLVSDALLFPDIDPFSFFPGHDENYPEVYMDVVSLEFQQLLKYIEDYNVVLFVLSFFRQF